MKSFAQIDQEQNGNYLKLLSAVSKLSGLFSESSVPFINYRVAENIFCRSFNAGNLSRSDTAFDANYNSIGIGLKTFTCNTNNSTEKVAEFNSLSRVLANFKGKELAIKLGEFRNDRINLANRLYNIDNALYHIVARKEKELVLFETDYNTIDINNIQAVKNNKASLQFEDGNNFYSFNYSKSTLFRKFIIPDNAFKLPIEIIEDPYTLLLELFENKDLKPATDKLIKGVNYVILPLYGIKKKEKFIFERSGLNQWNANGRKRDFGEVYIPIPAELHRKYPNFFPKRDQDFSLQIPTGEIFSAKVCQENSKALMTNPNKALSDWLLRKVLQLEEGELATIEKLDKLGFDSVIIMKLDDGSFKIDIMKTNTFIEFSKNE
tara:strand:+ start:1438 stop:2571 length:1134 start_codon:yes stop_codon:yes gene_type:complete